MYISLASKHSLKLKELELLLHDISNLLGSAVFIVGDMISHRLKEYILSSSSSNLLQYNGMTTLIATATRKTIDLRTLVHHVFHNQFFDKPD